MKRIKSVFLFIILSTTFIFFSYQSICAETKLRNSPKKLNDQELKTCVQKYNFFDKIYNDQGDFANEFIDNKDGTITDRATGLMWEQSGSKKAKSWYFAKKYIKILNKKKFAEYKDWRIPTIEELYSLLQPVTNQQLYIHPVFATEPSICWSMDKSDMTTKWNSRRSRMVTLDYKKGTVDDRHTGDGPGGASATGYWSYVRAVRSIK